ncbi:MAG: hypothetical protein ABIQ16_14545 [Polyangiaceae bacterium]
MRRASVPVIVIVMMTTMIFVNDDHIAVRVARVSVPDRRVATRE